MFPVITWDTAERRMKPASIRGPIFVSASNVPRSVPIRGAVRGGRLKMSARHRTSSESRGRAEAESSTHPVETWSAERLQSETRERPRQFLSERGTT